MENYIGTHNIFALVKSGKFSVESENEKFLVSQNEGAVFRYMSDDAVFENEYYFSNFFKKQTGMSPSAFRSITI